MMVEVRPIDETERTAWWRLSRTDGIGPITFFKLLERYGTATRALEMIPDLARRGGRKLPLAPFSQSETDRELSALQALGARVIAACEPGYPELLRQIDDAPPLITVLGNPALLNRPCVGIVGARNASLPGRKMALALAQDLGRTGYTVASGLARGIDTAAHEGSLTTGTIAVVAGGVDVIYPLENEKLYRQIAQSGIILSEHPAGIEPKAPFFPRRNRIISGLSRGVVVVEATLKSGSLITARCAAEQGRDVFAVPGSPLDPRAGGPNSLIREGALLIENAAQITEHLHTFKTAKGAAEKTGDLFTAPPPEPDEQALNEIREALLQSLSYTPLFIDEVVRVGHFNVQMVHLALLELELAGRVERLPGNRITLIDKDFFSELERARHR